MCYIRTYHYVKWKELTTVNGFGPGWVNGFRSIPWLLSDDVVGDGKVAILKCEYRRLVYLTLTVVLTFPVVAIILQGQAK